MAKLQSFYSWLTPTPSPPPDRPPPARRLPPATRVAAHRAVGRRRSHVPRDLLAGRRLLRLSRHFLGRRRADEREGGRRPSGEPVHAARRLRSHARPPGPGAGRSQLRRLPQGQCVGWRLGRAAARYRGGGQAATASRRPRSSLPPRPTAPSATAITIPEGRRRMARTGSSKPSLRRPARAQSGACRGPSPFQLIGRVIGDVPRCRVDNIPWSGLKDSGWNGRT